MTFEPNGNNATEAAHTSTGPRSVAGKAIVSQNAVRHGFLSCKLFIGDEDPAEFEILVDDLTSSLKPVGTLELALIEKIAVIMWRQRRLVRAESAALSLQQQPTQVAKAVNAELRGEYGNEVKADHMSPFDTDREQWCRAALAEFEALEIMDVPTMEATAPHLYGQLGEDAEGEDLSKFLSNRKGGIEGYLLELVQWCRSEISEADGRPNIHAVADLVRDRFLVLAGDTLELFSRYQTTLDSHLYKAMRALRDTQEARLRIVEAKSFAQPTVNRHRPTMTVDAD